MTENTWKDNERLESGLGETLTGLDAYGEIPLSQIEQEVLSVLNSSYEWAITPLGVRTKLENSGVTTQQVEEVLDGLVVKGFVEDVSPGIEKPRGFRAL